MGIGLTPLEVFIHKSKYHLRGKKKKKKQFPLSYVSDVKENIVVVSLHHSIVFLEYDLITFSLLPYPNQIVLFIKMFWS